MKPLSMDLRERIVAAYQAGEGSHQDMAERFSVSKAVVGKLVRQQKQLGTLEPQVHRRGRKPAISGQKEQELRAHLAEHPDATLEERHAALKVNCTVKTVWLTLRRWGWRFKKSPRGLPNKIGPMSPGVVRIGVHASPRSILSTSSSLMRPAYKPR